MSNRYSTPHARAGILLLDVRRFLPDWALTIHCACGRCHTAPMADLVKVRLGNLEQRTLGAVVARFRCQACGTRPASVVAQWGAIGNRIELVESAGR